MANKTSDLASSYSTTKRTKHPHYEMRVPNEQHQFDLFYVPHKENTNFNAIRCLTLKVAQRMQLNWILSS